ncbi:uncharacterized protein (TIGR02646 family) [Lacibacter cauensis]|uniref:Uncharacterized protein (TIGR02646 family) n=1 Tax=Lacibacter cauensis TaxID=510947 RepID=A0A562SX70_9BACT|nr:AAA family ATPase [Lacibacter cauensis]TWI85842.1 uncharacterized protein (TIGR02646 family) [Lacibacter cauensis]
MIKIKRTASPAYLKSDRIRNAKKKLEENFQKSDQIERMRFELGILNPIKADLNKMFQRKCAYCEVGIGINNIAEIDNFRPKTGSRGLNSKEYAPSHYWWLAYEWDNLFLACQVCSQKYKRDYFPLEHENLRCAIGTKGQGLLAENPLLINPCIDEPKEHILFEENGRAKEITKKGKVTIEILGLNRRELISKRKTVVANLRTRLNKLSSLMSFSSALGKRLVKEIGDLYSERPKTEHVAIQRMVFEKWFRNNGKVWQSLARVNKANSKVNLPNLVGTEITNDFNKKQIKAVTSELTSLKRFSIKSIEIENFKSIEHLRLNVKPLEEDSNRESWLLLLGDNGIGKSSILQAVALALTTQEQLAKLNLDVVDILRRGKENGKVIINSYEHDEPIVLEFDKNGFISKLKEAPTFILAYGSTRLLPKGGIQPDSNKEPYQNVRNLFDYSVSLNNPENWLNSLSSHEFKERVAPAFFDVLALRGDDKIWLKNGKINIQQFGEDHDLEDNSDGYKTITALVADIMSTLSLDMASYHNSQGIVLIDEIGNHLHPRWRMKIAGALRRAFPKLQFIVTTHEPLCLRGLSHGEVIVLVRDQKNTIKALDDQLLPDHNLMRIEQLLTSDLFGLINIVDEEVEKTYEEYYRLLSKKEEDKSQADIDKINELSTKLSEKEMLGNTPREQVLFKVIDQTIAQKIRDDGFKAQEVLKKETIEEVSNIVKSQNLDWL